MRLLKKANEIKCDCVKCGAEFILKNKDWRKVEHSPEIIQYHDPEKEVVYRHIYNVLYVKCPICKDKIIVKKERRND